MLLEGCCLLSITKSNKGERFHPQAQDYPGKQVWSTWTWKKQQAIFSPVTFNGIWACRCEDFRAQLLAVATHRMWWPSTQESGRSSQDASTDPDTKFFFLLLLTCPSKKQYKQTENRRKPKQPTKIKKPNPKITIKKPPTHNRDKTTKYPNKQKNRSKKALFMAVKEGMLMSTTTYNFSFCSDWQRTTTKKKLWKSYKGPSC